MDFWFILKFLSVSCVLLHRIWHLKPTILNLLCIYIYKSLSHSAALSVNHSNYNFLMDFWFILHFFLCRTKIEWAQTTDQPTHCINAFILEDVLNHQKKQKYLNSLFTLNFVFSLLCPAYQANSTRISTPKSTDKALYVSLKPKTVLRYHQGLLPKTKKSLGSANMLFTKLTPPG